MKLNANVFFILLALPMLIVTSPSQVHVNIEEDSTDDVVICVNVSGLSAFAVSVSYQFANATMNVTEGKDRRVRTTFDTM